MTDSMMPGRPWPAAIVLAGLALAGCSGGNVGSAWQCPLAQGGSCDSVAGADPAVPQADAAPADGMTIASRSTGRAAAPGPRRRRGPARRTATAASIPSAGSCGCSRRTPARVPAPDAIRRPGHGRMAGTIHGRPMPGR